MKGKGQAPAAMVRDTEDNFGSPWPLLLGASGKRSPSQAPKTPQCWHSWGLATPHLSPTRQWDHSRP